jgi:general stress protein 26
MSENLKAGIIAAKELLRSMRFVSVATVNEDGSPHNSPLFFIPDPNLEYFYWGSHPESLHSINVLRTGKLFAVIYDERGGLYIEAENGHILEGEDLEKALEVHNSVRARYNKKPLTLEYYSGNNPQRMWVAKIVRFSINTVERDADGHLARDGRQEISRSELLS